MLKHDFVNMIADKSGKSKKESEYMLEVILNCIADVLEKGETVKLVGFGNFEVVKRKEQIRHNPKNPSQKFFTPAYCAPIFKPSKPLKARVKSLEE